MSLLSNDNCFGIAATCIDQACFGLMGDRVITQEPAATSFMAMILALFLLLMNYFAKPSPEPVVPLSQKEVTHETYSIPVEIQIKCMNIFRNASCFIPQIPTENVSQEELALIEAHNKTSMVGLIPTPALLDAQFAPYIAIEPEDSAEIAALKIAYNENKQICRDCVEPIKRALLNLHEGIDEELSLEVIEHLSFLSQETTREIYSIGIQIDNRREFERHPWMANVYIHSNPSLMM